MERKDEIIIIERWELKHMVDFYRMLAYNHLAYIYNEKEFDYMNFRKYYFGSKQVPKLKEEL